MFRTIGFLLLLFVVNCAWASKPVIPWNLSLQLETMAQGKFRLVTQITSQRNLQGINVSIHSENVELLNGEESWTLDIGAGETKEFVLEYVALPSLGMPQWKAIAKVNYNGVRMARVARASVGGKENKMNKRSLNIRQGAEEYYVK